MAGKNTAVFGIYPNRTSAENAVDALKAAIFGIQTFPSFFPRVLARRILLMRKTRRRLKVPQPVPEPARC